VGEISEIITLILAKPFFAVGTLAKQLKDSCILVIHKYTNLT